MKKLLILFSLLLSFSACRNQVEVKSGTKHAGVYKLISQTIRYYSNNGKTLDSSVVRKNEGIVSLLYESPNVGLNEIDYSLTTKFEGWNFLTAVRRWSPTEGSENQLLFTDAPQGDASGRITTVAYTVTFLKNNQVEWRYIFANSGGIMKSEEVLILEKL